MAEGQARRLRIPPIRVLPASPDSIDRAGRSAALERHFSVCKAPPPQVASSFGPISPPATYRTFRRDFSCLSEAILTAFFGDVASANSQFAERRMAKG